MNLQSYITEAIAAFPKVVTIELVSRACTTLGVSPSDFCDRFAKEVARGYVDGELSWPDADSAMNALSGFFFGHLPMGSPFPDYAFGVYLAFDAGEDFEEPANERVTKEQLARLHAKT